MKLIKPSYQIIEPTGYTIDDIYKSIELAGKVSHKSEHTIKEGSAKDFVDRMIRLGHGATLEFGTVYLRYDFKAKEDSNRIAYRLWSKYNENKYSESVQAQPIPGVPNGFVAITTNLRVLIENNWLEDLKYLCEPTEYHHKRYTVKFICDRGISHELVRHRKFSFMQESTRYCNYSLGKFDKELTFIEPCWATNMDMFKEYPGTAEYTYDYTDQEKNISASAILFEQLETAERSYAELLRRGWKPEQARAVLPNALKTELYMCGFVSDWKNFFKLRDDKQHAHPQVYELAHPLHKEFICRNYIK